MATPSDACDAFDFVKSAYDEYLDEKISAKAFMTGLVRCREHYSKDLLRSQLFHVDQLAFGESVKCVVDNGGLEIVLCGLRSPEMDNKITALRTVFNIGVSDEDIGCEANVWLDHYNDLIVMEAANIFPFVTTKRENICDMTLPLSIFTVFDCGAISEETISKVWDFLVNWITTTEVDGEFLHQIECWLEVRTDLKADFYENLFLMATNTILRFYRDAIVYDANHVNRVVEEGVLSRHSISPESRFEILTFCMVEAPNESTRLILSGGSQVIRRMKETGGESKVDELCNRVNHRTRRLVKSC
mgnify:CR=1 FL=1